MLVSSGVESMLPIIGGFEPNDFGYCVMPSFILGAQLIGAYQFLLLVA
jgi:hypothetical protein